MDNKETIDSNTIEENFVKWKIPRPTRDYMVVVHCSTYNHGKYIEDALKGFVMQQTSFPFCAIIIDDGSTDDAPNIIRKYAESYPEIIKPILLGENHMQHGKSRNPYFDEWHNAAKYIAFCEGDDYWIDPLKLQKQVDFLEAHNEYSLCCHRYKIYNQNNDTWDADYVKELFDEHPDGFSFSNKENLNTWITKTLSLVYRRDCYDSKDLKKYKYTCDEHSCYHMLKKGMGYCFPFFGGVYRRCDVGVYSTLSPEMKEKRFFLIRAEMLQYNLEDKELRNVLFVYTREYLSSHILYREMRIAAMTCLQSFYRTDGFWTMLRAVWKFLKSYVYGLKTKKRNV